MTSYCYKTQSWKYGDEGTQLHKEHLEEELALLESPRGTEYLMFTNSKRTLAEAIAQCKSLIGLCEADLRDKSHE